MENSISLFEQILSEVNEEDPFLFDVYDYDVNAINSDGFSCLFQYARYTNNWNSDTVNQLIE